MTKEITIYILFILLTVSMGIVFQFMLARIKELNIVQKRIIKSMHSIHEEVTQIKSTKNTDRITRNKKHTRSGTEILRGDLTLEYNGSTADTRAVFMLDKE